MEKQLTYLHWVKPGVCVVDKMTIAIVLDANQHRQMPKLKPHEVLTISLAHDRSQSDYEFRALSRLSTELEPLMLCINGKLCPDLARHYESAEVLLSQEAIDEAIRSNKTPFKELEDGLRSYVCGKPEFAYLLKRVSSIDSTALGADGKGVALAVYQTTSACPTTKTHPKPILSMPQPSSTIAPANFNKALASQTQVPCYDVEPSTSSRSLLQARPTVGVPPAHSTHTSPAGKQNLGNHLVARPVPSTCKPSKSRPFPGHTSTASTCQPLRTVPLDPTRAAQSRVRAGQGISKRMWSGQLTTSTASDSIATGTQPDTSAYNDGLSAVNVISRDSSVRTTCAHLQLMPPTFSHHVPGSQSVLSVRHVPRPHHVPRPFDPASQTTHASACVSSRSPPSRSLLGNYPSGLKPTVDFTVARPYTGPQDCQLDIPVACGLPAKEMKAPNWAAQKSRHCQLKRWFESQQGLPERRPDFNKLWSFFGNLEMKAGELGDTVLLDMQFKLQDLVHLSITAKQFADYVQRLLGLKDVSNLAQALEIWLAQLKDTIAKPRPTNLHPIPKHLATISTKVTGQSRSFKQQATSSSANPSPSLPTTHSEMPSQDPMDEALEFVDCFGKSTCDEVKAFLQEVSSSQTQVPDALGSLDRKVSPPIGQPLSMCPAARSTVTTTASNQAQIDCGSMVHLASQGSHQKTHNQELLAWIKPGAILLSPDSLHYVRIVHDNGSLASTTCLRLSSYGSTKALPLSQGQVERRASVNTEPLVLIEGGKKVDGCARQPEAIHITQAKLHKEYNSFVERVHSEKPQVACTPELTPKTSKPDARKGSLSKQAGESQPSAAKSKPGITQCPSYTYDISAPVLVKNKEDLYRGIIKSRRYNVRNEVEEYLLKYEGLDDRFNQWCKEGQLLPYYSQEAEHPNLTQAAEAQQSVYQPIQSTSGPTSAVPPPKINALSDELLEWVEPGDIVITDMMTRSFIGRVCDWRKKGSKRAGPRIRVQGHRFWSKNTKSYRARCYDEIDLSAGSKQAVILVREGRLDSSCSRIPERFAMALAEDIVEFEQDLYKSYSDWIAPAHLQAAAELQTKDSKRMARHKARLRASLQAKQANPMNMPKQSNRPSRAQGIKKGTAKRQTSISLEMLPTTTSSRHANKAEDLNRRTGSASNSTGSASKRAKPMEAESASVDWESSLACCTTTKELVAWLRVRGVTNQETTDACESAQVIGPDLMNTDEEEWSEFTEMRPFAARRMYKQIGHPLYRSKHKDKKA
eukprot:m.122084 g.122084  ORF g.122084 m.122084 type:complete len:1258 (-) comp15650_c0_seq20:93-3866(-)